MNTDPQAQIATEEEQEEVATEEEQEEVATAKAAAEEEQAKKNELLEIYKLHAQLASDMANRLTTTNRFYLLLISGLFAFFFALLGGSDVLIPKGIDKKITIGSAIAIVACLGAILSQIWRAYIKNYYRMLSEKYTVLFLLELEAKFEFHFFENEWGKTEDIPYVQFSKFETAIPDYFTGIFLILVLVGLPLLLVGIFGGD